MWWSIPLAILGILLWVFLPIIINEMAYKNAIKNFENEETEDD